MPFTHYATLTDNDEDELVQIYGFVSERDRDVWIATFNREAAGSGLSAASTTVQNVNDAYQMLEYLTDAGS